MVQARKHRFQCRSVEPTLLMLVSVTVSVLISAPTASSLLINHRHHAVPSSGAVATWPFGTPSLRMKTRLKNNHANSDDDFASFSDFDNAGEDDGRELAREFYQELELRQSPSKDETYITRSGSGKNPQKSDGTNSIRTVRIRANTGGSNPSQRFTSQPAGKSSQESAPLFSLFPFLSFPAPAPRPTSAGLFSGSGATVYSSGRSIRAEIEILETTIKNNEAKNKQPWEGWDSVYVGNQEQFDEVIRAVALSLLILSAAYVAVEVSGVGAEIATWDDAVTSAANHVMSLMNDATKDGMSSIMIGVSNSEVFLGEEAAWLMKESSDLAASVVDAVRSVEELVLS